ncbi:MAG: hypothetical protein AAGF98_19825, partial [Cyanobacteria bacterium P01_H01_bin.153]
MSPSPTSNPGLSIKVKLTSMMLLGIAAIAAIVHFPWVFTSRRNVQQMVSQLHEESFRGAQNDAAAFFDNVLGTKHVILSSLENGLIELEDPSAQGQLYLNLLHSQEHLAWVQIGFANGDFLGAQRREDGLYHLDKRQWGDRLGELGEPGSALAVAQAEREEQAQVYAQTGELSELLGKPDWQVETYQFSPEDRTLTQVDS